MRIKSYGRMLRVGRGGGRRALLAAAVLASLGGLNVQAANTVYYLDANGAAAGSGVTNGSTYTATGAIWTTTSAGTAATAAFTSGASSDMALVAGTDAGGLSFNVSVAGANINFVNLTLNSGNATFTGAVNNFYLANSGTWNVASGSTLTFSETGGNAFNLNSKTLTFAGAGNVAVKSVISNAGNVTLTGSGAVSYSAANTYTGTTTLNNASATLALLNANALQNSTLAYSNGTLIFNSSVSTHAFKFGALAGSAAIALQDNAATPNAVALSIGSNNGTQTYSGSFSGAGSITKLGTGTETLSGANSYTGTTTVSAGALNFATTASLYNGDSSNWNSSHISVAGGATVSFRVGGAGEFATTDIDNFLASTGILASGATIGIDTTSDAGGLTYATAIADTAAGPLGFAKVGSNNLILSNPANSYTGPTRVLGGTLTIGDTTPYTFISNSIMFGNSTGSTLTTGAGSAIDISNATIDASLPGTASGISQALSAKLTGNGPITIKSYGDVTNTGSSNSSVFFLNNTNNDFVGNISITSGLVDTGTSDAPFGDPNNQILLNNGGLLANANTTYSSARVIQLTNKGYFRAYNGVTFTVNGPISGAGALYKTDGGKLLLTNASNTYAGATDIGGGTVSLSGSDTVLPGTTVVNLLSNGATLDVGATNPTIAGLTAIYNAGSTTKVIGTGVLTVNTGNFSVGGNLAGTATTSAAVTLNMSGLAHFTYQNSTGIFDVGPQAASSGGGGDTGALILGPDNTITASKFSIGNTYNSASVGNPSQSAIHLGANNTINAATVAMPAMARANALLDFNATGSTLTLRGLTGGTSRANINIAVGGAGSSTTSGVVDFTKGSVDVLANTVTIGDNTTQGNNGVTFNGTLKLGAGTFDATTVVLGQYTSGSGGTTDIANATLTLSNGGTLQVKTLTVGNQLNTNPGATVNSTYTQTDGTLLATTVAAGANAGGQVNRTFNFNGGTIQNYPATDLNFTSVPVTLGGAGVFSTDASQNIVLDANSPIGGTGSLVKIGNGTLTLAANNDYSGTTTVNAGVLNITGALGASSVTVSTNANATLAGSGTVGGAVAIQGATLSPGVSGVGTLTIKGPVSFTGSSTFAASVGSSSSQLVVANTGSLTLGNSTTLSLTGVVDGTSSYLLIDDQTSNAHDGSVFLSQIVYNGVPVSPSGSGVYTLGSSAYTLTYTADVEGNNLFSTTGNDVALTPTSVPEPASVLLLALGAPGLLLRRRRHG